MFIELTNKEVMRLYHEKHKTQFVGEVFEKDWQENGPRYEKEWEEHPIKLTTEPSRDEITYNFYMQFHFIDQRRLDLLTLYRIEKAKEEKKQEASQVLAAAGKSTGPRAFVSELVIGESVVLPEGLNIASVRTAASGMCVKIKTKSAGKQWVVTRIN